MHWPFFVDRRDMLGTKNPLMDNYQWRKSVRIDHQYMGLKRRAVLMDGIEVPSVDPLTFFYPAEER